MGLAARERATLAVLGVLALLGGLVVDWRQRPSSPVAAGAPEAARWDAALRRARQVDVNAAGVAELERLPRVGPTLARRIVAYRSRHGPFLRATELDRVPGIGPATMRGLEEYLTVEAGVATWQRGNVSEGRRTSAATLSP
jgi:competence protein ComEA